MRFFLDTANLDGLKKGTSRSVIDGVTTDSTPIARQNLTTEAQIFCAIAVGDISAVQQPLMRDGIDARSTLSKEGIRVNVSFKVLDMLARVRERRRPGFHHPLTDHGLAQFLKDCSRVPRESAVPAR